MLVVPNKLYDEVQSPDILVVTGGIGSRQAMRDDTLLRWVAHAAATAEIVLSVCSGARILGALGLMAGTVGTTHQQVFDQLGQFEPSSIIMPAASFIYTGKFINTSRLQTRLSVSMQHHFC